MIDRLVRYLKQQQLAFRLFNFPMPEPAPEIAAVPHRPVVQPVDTRVVLVGGRPALLCYAAGARTDLLALGRALGDVVDEGTPADLPDPFKQAEWVPPLGGLLGVPLLVDEDVQPGLLTFRGFSLGDFVELAFDELARVEQPRIVRFAIAGELPPATPSGETPKRRAAPKRAQPRERAAPTSRPALAKRKAPEGQKARETAAPPRRAESRKPAEMRRPAAKSKAPEKRGAGRTHHAAR